ncbi:MAG: hypothetical protein AABX28_00495 [Nanoarchaeota archaeon]
MELEENLKSALTELRKEKARKFDQSLDLVLNLQKFDVKKNQVNIFVSVPHKIKDKRIAAFLDSRRNDVETITKDDFKKYSDKKEIRKLLKKFDFFIASANLMANVATTFGRYLGPAGKMPSPQLGILTDVNDKSISEIKNKINNSVKIRTKEASVKMSVGKQSMKDEEIIENIVAVYNAMLKALPQEKDNIRNLEIKFTMSKPVKIKTK